MDLRFILKFQVGPLIWALTSLLLVFVGFGSMGPCLVYGI